MNVGRALRAGRVRAGLSQQSLAQRAQTSQSAVARYETGVATPSVATLERLLAATGSSLAIGPIAARPDRSARVKRSRAALLAAAERRGVRDLRVFGSVARDEAKPDSDVDLLVELEPGRTLINLIGFKYDAERILGCTVDVATPGLMKPRVRRQAIQDARPL